MRTSTALLGAVLVLGACGNKKKTEHKEPPTPAPEPAPKVVEPAKPRPVATKSIDLYRECIALRAANKLDAFKTTCVTADVKMHEIDGDHVSGADVLIERFAAFTAAFSDRTESSQLVIASPPHLLVVSRVTGTHTGDFGTIKKTGKRFGVLVLRHLVTDEQGKVSEAWEYADSPTSDAQLGLLAKQLGPRRPVLEQDWPAPSVLVAGTTETEKANLATWTKFATAFNAHRPDDMLAIWADDGLESDQAEAVDHRGKPAIAASLKGFLAAFPDVKTELSNTFAAGDWVIALGKVTGKNTGGDKPTGKTMSTHFAEVAKFKDGKIVELWRFRNGAADLAQLGKLGPEKN